jgi:hypothetical protein
MEELATMTTADGLVQDSARATNRGWFKPGSDPRINRQGRPRGRKAAAGDTRPVAERADRLMLLAVPARELAWRLANRHAPWIVNLPTDFEIVGSHVNRDGVVQFVIRSATFPRLARGAVIPSFDPSYGGLTWRRR